MRIIEKILCLLFFIIYLIVFVAISIYTIWSSKLLKSLFYTCFIPLILISIFCIIYIYSSFNLKPLFILNHLIFFKYAITLFKLEEKIFIILLSSLNFIYIYNKSNYRNYIQNCPFTFDSDLISFNESIYEKRRCELYNINMNSRYKYQYICSYNASKIFENDKTKDGFDKIICIPKINDINGNEIIIKFNKIYKDKNDNGLFYCSRIDKPEKDEYIKAKFCNMENNLPSIIYHLYDFLLIFYCFHNYLLKHFYKDLRKKIIEVVRQHINSLPDKEDSDTEYDESNSNNSSFIEEEDKNIILENHTMSNVDVNIKNFIEKETKT